MCSNNSRSLADHRPMGNINKDPIKSAIYNPKEFRQGRPHPTTQPAVRASSQRNGMGRWIAVAIVAGLVGGSVYAWERIQAKRAVVLPISGEYQRLYPPTISAPAPFKISARAATTHFFVKLEDWRTATPVVTAFVRKGEEIAINVPLGEFRLKYASGTNWMGPEALFGPTTSSSQATLPMIFRFEGNQYRGYVLDLTPRISGNLHTAPVGARSF